MVPPKRIMPVFRNFEPKSLGIMISFFLFRMAKRIPKIRLIAGLNTARDVTTKITIYK